MSPDTDGNGPTLHATDEAVIELFGLDPEGSRARVVDGRRPGAASHGTADTPGGADGDTDAGG